MTDTEGTTRTPETATPVLPDLVTGDQLPEDPDGYYENLDYARQQHLGLRPTMYAENADGDKVLHPDQRPCPPWCWVGLHPEYGHIVDAEHPTIATHTLDGSVRMLASCYPGAHKSGRGVFSATLEADLTQVGQGLPFISLAKRGYSRTGEQLLDNLLRLSTDDARELVRVLLYLLDLCGSDQRNRDGGLAGGAV